MLLIGNGRMITRDSTNPYFEDGCVAVKDNIICEVGTTSELKGKYPDAQFVDAKGGVIMPGLINTHNHIYSSFARGLAIKGHNPKNFDDILEGQWWKLDKALNVEETKYSALATYLNCIRNGVTTVFDHHASYGETGGSLFAISDAAKQLGVRTSLCYEVSDRNGVDKMKEAVAENVDFMKAAAADDSDMQKGMMGLHAAFTCSDETLSFCKESMPYDAGFHVHVAEGRTDVYTSYNKYGKPIVNRLYDLGILGEKTLAIHCVHVNAAEMEILKDTNTTVIHNPESNMGNAVGCGPVINMYEKGIMLGLGTDGYTNDMIESMKVGNILHKHNLSNPSVAWGEIPSMLFDGNAKIAGRYFSKPLGVLAEGAYADIVVMAYDPLSPMNGDNANMHILFGMNGYNTVATIINGKVVMKDRKIIGIDEAEVMAKCRELAQGLWGKVNP